MENIHELEGAIAALEAQRGVLGDSVVDLAQLSLREKLARLQSPAPSPAPEQQRKLITVLFADIVGSTQVGKGRDPEQILEIMDSSLQLLAEPVTRHHGRVTRFMGDGFIALFGLPLAYEDDAERAVRAGLEILQVARRLRLDMQAKFQISGFDVRVGINSGLVASGGFSEAEDTVMGLNVNLAQRLESAAPPGGMLISESTRRLVEGLFELRPVEAVVAKGFEQPVPAFLVSQAVRRWTGLPGQGNAGLDNPLAGRQAELHALQGIFRTVARDSRGAVVVLVGEPGMGKRRIVCQLADWIEQQDGQMSAFHGRARQPGGSAPYSLLRDVFSNSFDILGGDPVPAVRQKIEAGFGEFLGEEARMKAHLIAALLGYELGDSPYLPSSQTDADESRRRGLYYLQEYLSAVALKAPVVIYLEDAHAADRSSLQAIAGLTASLAELPLMVIFLARPTLDGILAELELTYQDGIVSYTRLDLPPLSPDACRELVRLTLHTDQVPQQLMDMVVSASAGNPYYISELLKILLEDGVISLAPDGATCQVDSRRLDNLRIPATLTALIQARLDSLPDEEKSTLQQASIVGDVFWDASLGALESNPARLSENLAVLARRGLLDPHPDSQFAGLQEYAFASNILREVVYETVLLRKRQSHHQQAGDWLVSVTQEAGRQAEYAAAIARHYHLAGQDRQAAPWYLTAGERALRQGAPGEACRFLGLALERLPAGDLETRWKVISRRSEALAITGDYPARIADDDALLAIAEQMNDPDRLADAYYHKGSFASITGEDRQAVTDLERAIQAARSAGNPDLLAGSLSLLALHQPRLGLHAAAQHTAEQALLQVSQVRDEVMKARLFTNIATYYSEAGDIPRAIGIFEELVEITRRLDERLGLAINLSNLGYNRLLLGLYADGLSAIQESIRIAQGIGARHKHAFARLNCGLAYQLMGEPAPARRELELAIQELEITNDPFGVAAGQHYLGRVSEMEGETSLAESYFELALAFFERSGLSDYAWDARAGLARCYLHQERLSAAEACARQLWGALGEGGGKGMEFPILAFSTCGRVFTRLGDLSMTRQVVWRGYQELIELANRIADQAWREAYLENVAENRELAQLWQLYPQEA